MPEPAAGEHEFDRAKVIAGDPVWGELQAR
jgi:hypothetical protein